MLTKKKLAQGVAELASRDGDLAAVIDKHGQPPLWSRKPGFPTLVQIILEGLSRLSDAEAKKALTSLVGIGRWTADIYLLMALRRPDIWPKGDLALAKAAQQVKGLEALPDQDQLEELAESWQPWRAVAARVLWLHYLSRD